MSHLTQEQYDQYLMALVDQACEVTYPGIAIDLDQRMLVMAGIAASCMADALNRAGAGVGGSRDPVVMGTFGFLLGLALGGQAPHIAGAILEADPRVLVIIEKNVQAMRHEFDRLTRERR